MKHGNYEKFPIKKGELSTQQMSYRAQWSHFTYNYLLFYGAIFHMTRAVSPFHNDRNKDYGSRPRLFAVIIVWPPDSNIAKSVKQSHRFFTAPA